MARAVACVGDLVPLFAPPGITVQALANGLPSAGQIIIPVPISGVVQRGSSKLRYGGRGVAHIGDPVTVAFAPTPPAVLSITGTITGTITIPTPLQATIEQGSETVRTDGRGIAHVGDPVILCFPPDLIFSGTIAGQPYGGQLQILTPVRGIIRGSSHFGVA